MRRVLLAPQEFKGTLLPSDVAEAFSRGIQKLPNAPHTDECPISDGGGGFLDSVSKSTKCQTITAFCRDPLQREMKAQFLTLDSGRIAVIEAAAAAGLSLLLPRELDPATASTEGVGDLIKAALDNNVEEILLGLGGTASLDAGVGLAKQLGVKFMNEKGQDIPSGAFGLNYLKTVDATGIDPRIRKTHLHIAADIANPLYGEIGIAKVYGPQKGASIEQISLFDSALRHFSEVLDKHFSTRINDEPGVGGGGGSGAVLKAIFGADIKPGFQVIAELLDLRSRIKDADLVLTGEGRLDAQTLFGKGPVGLARLAASQGVPTIAICGQFGVGWRDCLKAGMTAAFDLGLSIDTSRTPTDQKEAFLESLALAAEMVVRVFESSLSEQRC
jgi:glycerate kinase